MNQLNFRFPGLRSFYKEDSNSFFGREEEFGLLEMVLQVKRVGVIFGRSGTGKSSLANMTIAKSEKFRNWSVHFFRISPAIRPPGYNISQLLIKKITSTWEDINNGDRQENSITNLRMAIQCLAEMDPSRKTFLLVFDQFEDALNLSLNEFAELKNLLKEITTESNALGALSPVITEPGQYENRLPARIYIKMLFVIRSDALHWMNNLSDVFPEIFKDMIEIRPLTPSAATRILTATAAMEGPFQSSPFMFENEALNRIINSLVNDLNEIEPFQLQMIGHWIENELVLNRQLKYITAEAAPDFNKILANFYEEALNRLSISEKVIARKIIEEELVLTGHGGNLLRRAVDQSFLINKYNININLISKLIDTRLLRATRSEAGIIIELAHDTLLAAISEAKKVIQWREISEQKIQLANLSFQRKTELELNSQLGNEKDNAIEAFILRKKHAKTLKIITTLLLISVLLNLLLLYFLLK